MFGAPCIGMAVAVTLRPIWSGFDAASIIALASVVVAVCSLAVAVWAGHEQRTASRTMILDARLEAYLGRYSALEARLRGGINQSRDNYNRLSLHKRTQLQLVFASLISVLDSLDQLREHDRFQTWQGYLKYFPGPLLDDRFDQLCYAQRIRTRVAIKAAIAAAIVKDENAISVRNTPRPCGTGLGG
ncbi:hypothetical protein HNP47_000083 [Brevundimonas vesicularis]|uniref:Uncharacterized protein n=1 Tax=Brevundimonas vesicularis TaxID=41276 RepID=A0A7W9L4B3_BREVE|nr:hypothetical protein [Brevundimonas vesicularis]MBB5770114.1 hypothetical protein [Brevundimonas vesicularis]